MNSLAASFNPFSGATPIRLAPSPIKYEYINKLRANNIDVINKMPLECIYILYLYIKPLYNALGPPSFFNIFWKQSIGREYKPFDACNLEIYI